MRPAIIPVLLMSSWYDVYVPTNFENLAGLSRGRHRPQVVMGPWTHGNRTKRVFGDVDFGPLATFDGNVGESWTQFRIACFDRWFGGAGGREDEPRGGEPALRFFLMGGGSGRRTQAGKLDHGGRWISTSQWPPAETEPTAFYLHEDGSLDTRSPVATDAAITYNFDPAIPCRPSAAH